MVAGAGRRPLVVDGLVCPDPTVMAWAGGEREQWRARAAALGHGRERPEWVLAATGADRLSDLQPMQVPWLIAQGPEAPARALIATPSFIRLRERIDLGRVAVARFELGALPLALSEAGDSADRLGVLMLPFRGPEPAALVAGWLRHLGSARLWARLWLGRHPEAAARALIPAAAGKPGKPRQNAEDALRHLAATGHRPMLARTAEGYGPRALVVLNALLESGPPPVRVSKKATGWAERLPAIRLAGGGTMPADDVALLFGALTRSRLADPPEPAPGDPAPPTGDRPLVVESAAAAQPLVRAPEPAAAKLIAGADRASLAAYGRALLDAWLADGLPAAEAWVVPAQAHLGDDATMDRLAPLVRSWPALSRWARAVDGLAVLATVGTPTALRHLLAIEDNMVGGPTNERAVVHLTQAAARHGWSVTQLADRLTVTHGLAAGITFDYGPRSFRLGTDEHLTPYVMDLTGRRRARPPRPGARDTNPDAYEGFVRLKKDLRATVTAQIARLEREMLGHRFRPAGDLAAVLLPHPVLGPLGRRLLWGEYDAEGRLVRGLRIAEDGSFADIHDTTVTLDPGTPLGIVHPAELGPDLAVWMNVFADYEILPPFAQLHRPVVTPAGAATSLAGFGPVAAGLVEGLLRKGWEGNGYATGKRLHTQLERQLPGGLTVLVELDPGVPTSSGTVADRQRITEIWVDESWSDHWQVARRIAFAACDPGGLSEALAEVYALREGCHRPR